MTRTMRLCSAIAAVLGLGCVTLIIYLYLGAAIAPSMEAAAQTGEVRLPSRRSSEHVTGSALNFGIPNPPVLAARGSISLQIPEQLRVDEPVDVPVYVEVGADSLSGFHLTLEWNPAHFEVLSVNCPIENGQRQRLRPGRIELMAIPAPKEHLTGSVLLASVTLVPRQGSGQSSIRVFDTAKSVKGCYVSILSAASDNRSDILPVVMLNPETVVSLD